ncbi:MAG TPA: HK97 family phage prohead protease [Gaiellaceae bacterium]|nr:HK97 family phage prohead protease [Gaiellaceae bacterium]
MTIATRPPAKTNTKPIVGHMTVPLKDVEINANGQISGYAAVFGNRDDGGDIIEPGFFANVIEDFLREGFIAWNHDWSDPVAIPIEAREDGVGLYSAAEFHSTPRAQEARTIASERQAAGKQVGLSIGYEIAPGGATIEKDGRHLRKASRLFEWSLVTVPMNRLAEATDVKSHQAKAAADNVATASYILQMVLDLIQAEASDLDPADPDVAEDEQDLSTLGQIRDLIGQYLTATAQEVGTADDMTDLAEEEAEMPMMSDWGYMGRTKPLAEHSALVAKAAKSFQQRVKNLNRLRVKEGRVLSSSNVERLQGHIETLSTLVSDMKDLLASASADKGANALDLAFMETMARASGHLTPN